MKLLNQIRDTLTDPDRRAKYDRELAEGTDTARVESAINETLRQSRGDVLFWRRVKLTALAGLALGLLLGLGTWFFGFMQRRQPEPSPAPAVGPLEASIPVAAPSVPKAAPAALPAKKRKGPEVVEFGSTTEQVMKMMGTPDQVEELAGRGFRILHYGALRLVFKNNKLVPGSGIQRDR